MTNFIQTFFISDPSETRLEQFHNNLGRRNKGGKNNAKQWRTVHLFGKSRRPKESAVVIDQTDTTGYLRSHSGVTTKTILTEEKFPDNTIVTSRYTIWNFIPKNLFEQFGRIANFYFLCIAVVQLSLRNSPVSPVTSVAPLLFVVTITAIKQAYEDWLRHKSDNKVNNRSIEVVRDGTLKGVPSRNVAVGDVVRVSNEQELPCDLVLLSSSEVDGSCYIMTMNLDGETNLKPRLALSDTVAWRSCEDITSSSLDIDVDCQLPTPDLYKSLCSDNLLLRGARLRNTDYIFGMAVYTGVDTKVALNQQQKKHKFSAVEKALNKFLAVFMVLLVIQVIFCGIASTVWQRLELPAYMGISRATEASGIINIFLSFLVLFNYIIPISLYVTIGRFLSSELQKFFGAMFIGWDIKMYDSKMDEVAKANTSDLNEELGQIEYLFSDKTGTLTQNDMQFRQCSIYGKRYKEIDGNLQLLLDQNYESLEDSSDSLQQFLIALAVCHTVKTEHEASTDSIVYQASSPDEKALVEAASKFGVSFRDCVDNAHVVLVHGKLQRFKILHVLEFDSDRKRMSVIVKDPSGNTILICKGAESSVLSRAKDGAITHTNNDVNYYAKHGLRTLVIAFRRLSVADYEMMNEKLHEAKTAIGDRDAKLASAYDYVERDLTIIGATAVEDKLQECVTETLESLREAGIKVWVLTGDKQETAVNISHSCGHFSTGMEIMTVNANNNVECSSLLQDVKVKIDGSPGGTKFALVINGMSLSFALSSCQDLLLSVTKHCEAVLCCRMSPLQKAKIVRMVKENGHHPTTLAIGDGANDCSMIQEAHVGVGIMGKEGRQATQCSDYAIAKFKYLKRLLLVHGHWYYIRIATLVQYFFYKNAAFITPEFYFAFFSGFSAQSMYDSIFLMFFNLAFTSLPILIFGVFEQDFNEHHLLRNPSLYKMLARNKYMTMKEFACWVLLGYWHSLVFFFGVYFLFAEQEGVLSADGKTFDLWCFGTMIYTMTVVVTNLKLALHTEHWTWVNHFAIWISILSYYLFTLFYCGIYWPTFRNGSSDLFWIFLKLVATPAVWFKTFLLILVSLLPDIILRIYSTEKVKILNLSLEKMARTRMLGDRLASENTSLNRDLRKRNYSTGDPRNPLISSDNSILDISDSHQTIV
ncbi:uncharacterized protein TRIADDRAFT_56098 [Trichoplax adhaerens]|uniref:Phospholipid-transporting ATPase n=1 Tax=Trichoplax adhaerens TaxID=10228 RepID=B3RTZ4_TRIAD|nr:hypothetical protein TRIADDRAFT_56098 [Trichoplax adhaerens]EDV25711.1 hypothetical protein TRIADDRAFT_56098 [Trichoplax adhaerens]|eukprot:XP_002111744.1 hypothetical protein TRIADDRAFT_56098 [Trichoplax adhaerens]